MVSEAVWEGQAPFDLRVVSWIRRAVEILGHSCRGMWVHYFFKNWIMTGSNIFCWNQNQKAYRYYCINKSHFIFKELFKGFKKIIFLSLNHWKWNSKHKPIWNIRNFEHRCLVLYLKSPTLHMNNMLIMNHLLTCKSAITHLLHYMQQLYK